MNNLYFRVKWVHKEYIDKEKNIVGAVIACDQIIPFVVDDDWKLEIVKREITYMLNCGYDDVYNIDIKYLYEASVHSQWY